MPERVAVIVETCETCVRGARLLRRNALCVSSEGEERINTKLMRKLIRKLWAGRNLYTFTYIHISVVPSFGRVELSHAVFTLP